MEGLVKVQTTQEGTQVVSARDLHQFVVVEANGGQTGEMFAHWIKRMLEFGFKEGLDYTIEEYDLHGNLIAKSSKSDNQEVRVHKREYILTLDTAKHIAMVQKNDKGEQARRYFIECESKLKTLAFPNFTDPAEAAEAWAKEYRAKQKALEEKKQLELKVQEDAPKVEFFDDLVDRKLNLNFRTTAKEIGIKESVFIQFLLDKKYIYRGGGNKLLPYAQYVGEDSLFVIKEQKTEKWAGTQTLITPKGRARFLILLGDKGQHLLN